MMESIKEESNVTDAGRGAVFGGDARALLAAGACALADAVGVTLGPRGRNVIIGMDGAAPVVTKDGVTVARRFVAEGAYERLGAEVVRQAAVRTAEDAGDGTTTATVLARALIEGGMRNVAAGADPTALKRGMDAACRAVVAEVARMSVPVDSPERVRDVAVVSTNMDEGLGGVVAEAFTLAGPEGFVTMGEAQGKETSVEVQSGVQFPRGFLSRHFITDPARQECVMERPLVLVVEGKLGTTGELGCVLNAFTAAGDTSRPLLVIAEGVGEECLALLVANRLRGRLGVCAVSGPSFGQVRREWMDDIAAMTGATVVSNDRGRRFEAMGPEWFGSAERAVVGTYGTTLMGPGGREEDVETAKAAVRRMAEEAQTPYEREKLMERLGRLAGSVAVIYVGAATEVELRERRMRVEDAIGAVRAAVAEGVVPGAGTAYIRARRVLEGMRVRDEDGMTGVRLVWSALEAPLRAIAHNAGADGGVVVRDVSRRRGAVGWDALSGRCVDLLGAGVADPARVVRCALENAVSVAGMLLTTDCSMLCAG